MTAANKIVPLAKFDWRARLRELAQEIAERAERHDSEAAFVADNMASLHRAGFFTAAVPAELGGGGCGQTELGDMLRQLARSCGSTALALSMHTHLVAALALRWRKDPNDPAGRLLQRIVDERLTLVSSGGSDWLDGSCRAEPVEGGYRISGRKIFASGSPRGDLLLTTARLDEADG